MLDHKYAGEANAPLRTEAVRQKEILTNLTTLEKSIESLQLTVDQVISELSTVLAPEHPYGNSKESEKSKTELGERIFIDSLAINNIRDRLQDVLSRLEI